MKTPCPNCRAPLIIEIESLIEAVKSAVFTGLPVTQFRLVTAHCFACGKTVTGGFDLNLVTHHESVVVIKEY